MKHNNSNHCNTKGNSPFALDKFFDDVLGNFEGVFGRDMNSVNHGTPHVNVIDEDEQFKLEVAAPGWSKSDFSIHLDKNILMVETKVEDKIETKEGERVIRREFAKKSLKRSFTLPENVDKESISAKYVNGILSIGIPKIVEKEIVKTIDIK
ncbi:MAG: HSP20 family protein [Maribacter sp.]|jgi:HSP20 family protein